MQANVKAKQLRGLVDLAVRRAEHIKKQKGADAHNARAILPWLRSVLTLASHSKGTISVSDKEMESIRFWAVDLTANKNYLLNEESNQEHISDNFRYSGVGGAPTES